MNHLLLRISFAGLLSTAPAFAAFNLTTTGVYDENAVATNAIEAVAGIGLATGGTAAAELHSYKTLFNTSYTNITGGVISFDNKQMTGTSETDAQLSVPYGVGSVSTLTITNFTSEANFGLGTTGAYQYQSNSALGTPTSGGPFSSYLRVVGSGDPTRGAQGYNFSTPLAAVAFTALSRDNSRTLTATVFFTDGTTAQLSDTVGAGITGVDDTFFGFTAPSDKAIQALYIRDATIGNFFAIDDLAFVISPIPEPSAAGLAALATGACLLRRRRA